MNILSYPMRYATLENEAGGKLYKRDVGFVLLITTVLSLPFIVLGGNFFGTGGLLDRVGTFSSVLTGFYIAALVGVASLSASVGDLDEVITQGPIFAPSSDGGEPEELSRRQYVCSLFGYLAFISLFLAISAIVCVVFSAAIPKDITNKIQVFIEDKTGYNISYVEYLLWIARSILIIFYSMLISHVVATTCHGLYYYIDKIYDKKSVIGSKKNEDDPFVGD